MEREEREMYVLPHAESLILIGFVAVFFPAGNEVENDCPVLLQFYPFV
jgi:hypothetical protein